MMNPRALTFFTLVGLLFLSGCASIQGALFDFGIASERSRSSLVENTVEIDEQVIHYVERSSSSSDAPTLLLIHGFAANKDHWVRFARFVPESFRIVALDLTGHGENEPDTTTTYSISNQTERVSVFIERVVGGPVYVVGNSMGGLIAVALALDYPDLIQTLSLLNPAGLVSPEPSELDLAVARGQNLLIPTTRDEYDAFTSIAFGDNPPNLPWPTASVITRQYAERAPLYRKIWSDIRSEDGQVETRLPALDLPTLIIWGDQDGVLDVSAASVWNELIPNSELVVMPGVGHAPMLERPEESATLVITFIEKAR